MSSETTHSEEDWIIVPASEIWELTPQAARILLDGADRGLVKFINPERFPDVGIPRPEDWPRVAWPAKRNGRRVAIPRKVRQRVLSRGRCGECDSPENLEVDHIVPVSRGGTNEESNLQPLCRSCNSTKRARLPKGRR